LRKCVVQQHFPVDLPPSTAVSRFKYVGTAAPSPQRNASSQAFRPSAQGRFGEVNSPFAAPARRSLGEMRGSATRLRSLAVAETTTTLTAAVSTGRFGEVDLAFLPRSLRSSCLKGNSQGSHPAICCRSRWQVDWQHQPESGRSGPSPHSAPSWPTAPRATDIPASVTTPAGSRSRWPT
jgi:hypothetical protein